MKKAIYLFVYLLIISLTTHAQYLSPTVINSAGKHLPVNNFTFEYSIGEVVINTFESNNNYLTQGFLQPFNFEILEEVKISIPNVITPNGDNLNEFFYITNIEYFSNPSINIYNRLGQLVFQSAKYQNDWNGNRLPSGTYFYRLLTYKKNILKEADKAAQEYKGWIQILR